MTPIPWHEAWQEALYGPRGFFATGAGPSAHFRTAVHAAPGPLAGALLRLAERHGRSRVLDVGAGRGELVTAIAAIGGSASTLHGVDVVPRPTELPEGIGWSQGLPAVPAAAFDDALVVAWEVLDDVPCPVLQIDDDGSPATVLVDPITGEERLEGEVPRVHRRWCERWWPFAGAEAGDRIEVGLTRDAFWETLTTAAAGTDHGATLLAVDYGHRLGDRPPGGTLMGYRDGRAVRPVPDGRCDVTAHVALDAVADAGETAGARSTLLTDQRTALLDLGIRPPPGPLPPGGVDLLRALALRSSVAEVLDRDGLGGFGWLVQDVPGRRDR